MKPTGQGRWRLWLVLIFSAGGGLLALSASALLFASGGLALFNDSIPAPQGLPVLNLAWVSALVGVLCIPAVVLTVRELSGKVPPLARPSRRGLLYASLAMLVWGALAAGFDVLETSSLAWLVLPPAVLLATLIPLWWYIEMGRRGLALRTPTQAWGTISLSLVVTLPVILVLELLVLLILLVGFGVFAGADPQLSREMMQFGQQLRAAQNDPALLEGLLSGLFQQPAVVGAMLLMVAGIIPFLEELFKPLAVWLLAGTRLSPAQGFLAGMLSGACFALWENLTALATAGDGSGTFTLMARVGTGLLHIVTAGIVSWGMASAWQSRSKLPRLVGVYLAAVFMHGLWNAFGLLAGVAPVMRVPASLDGLTTGLGKAAPVVLVMMLIGNFIALLLINRALLRQEKARLRLESEQQVPAPESPETGVQLGHS